MAEEFPVEHLRFRFGGNPADASAFVLTTEAPGGKPLFTGFVHPGMAQQLRAMADHVAVLEGAISTQVKEQGT